MAVIPFVITATSEGAIGDGQVREVFWLIHKFKVSKQSGRRIAKKASSIGVNASASIKHKPLDSF